jgi:hypothetical protein
MQQHLQEEEEKRKSREDNKVLIAPLQFHEFLQSCPSWDGTPSSELVSDSQV